MSSDRLGAGILCVYIHIFICIMHICMIMWLKSAQSAMRRHSTPSWRRAAVEAAAGRLCLPSQASQTSLYLSCVYERWAFKRRMVALQEARKRRNVCVRVLNGRSRRSLEQQAVLSNRSQHESVLESGMNSVPAPPDAAPQAASIPAMPAVPVSMPHVTHEGAAEPQLAYTDIPPLTEAQERAHALLEASGRFLPLPSDVPKPRRYSPTTHYVHKDPNGQPYYPVEPARSFDDPGAFERYDVDTLFFIFYYQQGTYQQDLAAKELKKLNWRYHTKGQMWFQRHEEPRMITQKFERGTYVCFDHETSNQRLKQGFIFEYVWLESADV